MFNLVRVLNVIEISSERSQPFGENSEVVVVCRLQSISQGQSMSNLFSIFFFVKGLGTGHSMVILVNDKYNLISNHRFINVPDSSDWQSFSFGLSTRGLVDLNFSSILIDDSILIQLANPLSSSSPEVAPGSPGIAGLSPSSLLRIYPDGLVQNLTPNDYLGYFTTARETSNSPLNSQSNLRPEDIICGDGSCVDESRQCDGRNDCPEGIVEANFGKTQSNEPNEDFQLPEPIPIGHEISDTTNRFWIIGSQIGSGRFGKVYLASAKENPKDLNYVVKIDYHANGPLFAEIEMQCCQSILKPARIQEWVKQNKLTYLGLSPCHGFGSFEYKTSKFCFKVLERYGKDLQRLLEENFKFPPETVYNIGLSVINVLEYIHYNGYIHVDVKAANLLLGFDKKTENQVYLVDMGLACKYLRDGVHKKEDPDPKKEHNGTPEFTSRDAHRGCFSRRSDIEHLCYNLLQWLCGELPWECNKADNKKLLSEKESFMKNIKKSLSELFEDEDYPDGIYKLLSYVCKLKFEDEPDYEFCKKVLKEELKKLGSEKTTTLKFKSPTKKKRSAVAKKAKEPVSDKENSKRVKAKLEKKNFDSPQVLDNGVSHAPAMLEIPYRKSEVKETKSRRKK